MAENPLVPLGPPVDMLVETQELYRWSAKELIRIITALREGESTDTKAAGQAIRDLRTALGWAIDERQNVDKITKNLAAAAGAVDAGFDLDAARDEIGRRLARLRASKGDAGISEQFE